MICRPPNQRPWSEGMASCAPAREENSTKIRTSSAKGKTSTRLMFPNFEHSWRTCRQTKEKTLQMEFVRKREERRLKRHYQSAPSPFNKSGRTTYRGYVYRYTPHRAPCTSVYTRARALTKMYIHRHRQTYTFNAAPDKPMQGTCPEAYT